MLIIVGIERGGTNEGRIRWKKLRVKRRDRLDRLLIRINSGDLVEMIGWLESWQELKIEFAKVYIYLY